MIPLSETSILVTLVHMYQPFGYHLLCGFHCDTFKSKWLKDVFGHIVIERKTDGTLN